jgi:hypothetical protein
VDKHDFYPRPSSIAYTSRAALMGPDDHRHSGERAAYGSFGFGYLRRAEPLAMFPLAFACSKERPMRQSGQKAVTGRVASHTQHRLVPFGRTTRPGLP